MKPNEKTFIVFKAPGVAPMGKEMDGRDQEEQELVGGLIEEVRQAEGLPDGLVLVCNQEGPMLQLEPNICIRYTDGGQQTILGPCYLVSRSRGAMSVSNMVAAGQWFREVAV